jgi:arsenate reductase (thioredoxin)
MNTINSKNQLIQIATLFQQRLDATGYLNLNFICTHNSRRSQLAQAWSHALAQEMQLPITSYSGGTEVTACHPNTIETLKRAGFSIQQTHDVPNAPYEIRWKQGTPLTLFSKLFDDPINPNQHFFALMTCSDADENCPFIPGALQRIPLRYHDPKYADGTDKVIEAYDACSSTIHSEIAFIFKLLKK